MAEPETNPLFELLDMEDELLELVIPALTEPERAAVLKLLEAEDISPYIKYNGDLKAIITQEWNEVIWSKQEEILDSVRDNQRTCVVTTPGVGKDLPLDTPIPTPSGWTTMGDVAVGDYVLGQDGAPTMVTAVTGTQHNNLFRVTFNDGTSIVAGEDHQWSTLDGDTRRRVERRMRVAGRVLDWREHWPESRVHTTLELAETVWSPTQNRWNHLIPVNAPLRLPAATLPLDPYVLGAWLGDGDSRRPYMTIGDDGLGILDGFADADTPLVKLNGHMRYSFPGPAVGHTQRILRSLDVLKNKHIPALYLRASYDQRLSLLRGIMDTDGSVHSGGAAIDLCDERLALDVAELIRSLGVKLNVREAPATLNGRAVGTRYRMAFRSSFNPFGYVGHKVDGWGHEPRNARTTGRVIVSVEPVETVPTRCIKVDSERHLYLVGKDFLPTHNSDVVSMIVCAIVASALHAPTTVRVITTANSFRQVKTIMWPYIKRIAQIHKLPGGDSKYKPSRIGAVEWHIDDVMVADGVASADNDETAMRGIHSLGRVYVIVDEASGISHTIGRVLNGLLTTEDDRLIVLGNPPTDETNTWFEWLAGQAIVNTITIPYTETPNFSGELTGICTRCKLLNPYGEEHRISKHLTSVPSIEAVRAQYPDEQDPYIRAFLYAEFPTGSTAKAIPMQFLQNAMPVTHKETDPETGVTKDVLDPEWTEHSQRPGPIRLGIDIASDGGDEFVIAKRRGWHGSIIHYSSGPANEDATIVAGIAMKHIREAAEEQHEMGYPQAVEVNVDRNGVGWGVTSILQEKVVEEKLNVVVVGVMVSEKARQETRFSKQRDELWWNFRELLADAHTDVTLADDRNLGRRSVIMQLNGPTYETGSDGRTKIEGKAKMKTRTGGRQGISPDRADAMLLAYYDSPSRRRNIAPSVFPELTKANEHKY